MVVVYGAFYNATKIIQPHIRYNWTSCLQKCWEQWDCVVVHQLSEGCRLFSYWGIDAVKKLDSSSGEKVGIKISLPSDTCPRDTKAPPLFGNVSSSLILSVFNKTIKSEITESQDIWSFNYSIHKCLTDIPEDYVPLNITKFPYEHKLTTPFVPGETFFIRGKTPGFNQQISISFLNKEANDWAIYIMINQDRNDENNIVISTWKHDVLKVRDDGMNNLENPYAYYTDFEIRVTSNDTVAKISFNGTEYEYELYPDVPLTEIDYFSVNYNAYGYQTGTVDFLGWTGDCEVVRQLSDGCQYFKIEKIRKLQKKDSSSGQKVGIKISLPFDTCPRDTEPPPLFGNVSSSLIITDGSDNYYKSEITETSDGWNFNYSIHQCLTDIPEDYVPLGNTTFPYEHKLTSPFLPGETFFMRGKTAGYNEQTSIAFWKKDVIDLVIYIMINEDRNGLNNIVISTWKHDVLKVRDDGMNKLPNPYAYYTDFEIRVTSNDTVAKISFNGTEYEYELYPDVPLTEIDYFSVNYNAGKYGSYQTGTVDFLGWTGDCEYKQLCPMNDC